MLAVAKGLPCPAENEEELMGNGVDMGRGAVVMLENLNPKDKRHLVEKKT